MATDEETQSFWEHLGLLRIAILKSLAMATACGLVAFFLKEKLFAIVLAPKDNSFVIYRLFDKVAQWMGERIAPFSVQLINTGLARQFIIHMKTALCAGLLCASLYPLSVVPLYFSGTL